MLGRKELQETLTQKETLLTQREAEIGVLTKRVEELTGREKQMQAELAAYRERGNAIVNALTDAQQAASRIREEAERQKAQIIASAYADRDAARKEADTVLQNAREQAAQIVARSEEEAAGGGPRRTPMWRNWRVKGDACGNIYARPRKKPISKRTFSRPSWGIWLGCRRKTCPKNTIPLPL